MDKGKLLIVQINQYKWKIETENGHVLQNDISLSSVSDANLYCRNYVSSFLGWTYDVVPMPKEEKKKRK